MRPSAILFDFDGTLIDSARSILGGFQRALEREGITPAVPLSPSLIGPPLPRTLATLSGSDDPALIARLSAAYRADYDGGGYRETEVYPGVAAMLEALAAERIALHIVTNKRIAPTRLILDHLAWTPWFRGIYALDAIEPAAPHKSALVREVLALEGLSPTTTWMVGDSAEDRSAALGNGLRFFSATWGYGAAGAEDLAHPQELVREACNARR